MERFASNELEKRVDEVLFYVWDPIGINDTPYARAEYRSYVTSVLGHVKYEKSAEEIADLLCKIETEQMGLSRDMNKALKVAKLLIEHKEAIDEGCA
tara:strand:- start:1956 stop:2246 length:291 start_codon:yes stop_codon:yes gene_type:complete